MAALSSKLASTDWASLPGLMTSGTEKRSDRGQFPTGAGVVAGDSVIEIHCQVDALTPAVAVEEYDRATGTDQQVVGWIVGSKDELGCLEDSPPFGLVADEDGIEKGSGRSGLVGDNGSGVCGEYGIDSEKEQTGRCVTSKSDRNSDQLVPGRQGHNLVACGSPIRVQ